MLSSRMFAGLHPFIPAFSEISDLTICCDCVATLLESHHCATPKSNSHGIISLQKLGEGAGARLFATLLHSPKLQLTYFHALPHSFAKNTRVGVPELAKNRARRTRGCHVVSCGEATDLSSGAFGDRTHP